MKKRPASEIILYMYDQGYEMCLPEVLDHLRSDGYTNEETTAAFNQILEQKLIRGPNMDGVYVINRRKIKEGQVPWSEIEED